VDPLVLLDQVEKEDVMELMEPQGQVVVQEQMDQVDLVVTQEHQVVMVLQGHQVQVELVGQVVVMVQEVRQEVQVQVLRLEHLQAQEAQELQVHLDRQVNQEIDTEHLLQVN
jgi:hypothetical protein